MEVLPLPYITIATAMGEKKKDTMAVPLPQFLRRIFHSNIWEDLTINTVFLHLHFTPSS